MGPRVPTLCNSQDYATLLFALGSGGFTYPAKSSRKQANSNTLAQPMPMFALFLQFITSIIFNPIPTQLRLRMSKTCDLSKLATANQAQFSGYTEYGVPRILPLIVIDIDEISQAIYYDCRRCLGFVPFDLHLLHLMHTFFLSFGELSFAGGYFAFLELMKARGGSIRYDDRRKR